MYPFVLLMLLLVYKLPSITTHFLIISSRILVFWMTFLSYAVYQTHLKDNVVDLTDASL